MDLPVFEPAQRLVLRAGGGFALLVDGGREVVDQPGPRRISFGDGREGLGVGALRGGILRELERAVRHDDPGGAAHGGLRRRIVVEDAARGGDGGGVVLHLVQVIGRRGDDHRSLLVVRECVGESERARDRIARHRAALEQYFESGLAGIELPLYLDDLRARQAEVERLQAEQEWKALQRVKAIRHPFLLGMDRVEVVPTRGHPVVYAEWLGRLNDFRRRTERDYCRRCGAGKLVLDECGVCDTMRRRDPEFVDWLLKVISNTVWSRRY